jgi:hypothetical protein
LSFIPKSYARFLDVSAKDVGRVAGVALDMAASVTLAWRSMPTATLA